MTSRTFASYDTMPSATYLGPPAEPEPRFPSSATVAGATYDCDPAAVARLHALLGTEQRRATKAARPDQRADCGDLMSNLRRSARRVNAGRRKTLTAAELADVVARRARGEPWRRIAASHGMSGTTLRNLVASQSPRLP